jgi:hypothetical protein
VLLGFWKLNCYLLYTEYAAEGLEIGNSVYWIRFGEEYSQKKFKSSSPFGIEYVFHLEVPNLSTVFLRYSLSLPQKLKHCKGNYICVNIL